MARKKAKKELIPRNIFTSLSAENEKAIFSYLDIISLWNCHFVCRDWPIQNLDKNQLLRKVNDELTKQRKYILEKNEHYFDSKDEYEHYYKLASSLSNFSNFDAIQQQLSKFSQLNKKLNTFSLTINSFLSPFEIFNFHLSLLILALNFFALLLLRSALSDLWLLFSDRKEFCHKVLHEYGNISCYPTRNSNSYAIWYLFFTMFQPMRFPTYDPYLYSRCGRYSSEKPPCEAELEIIEFYPEKKMGTIEEYPEYDFLLRITYFAALILCASTALIFYKNNKQQKKQLVISHSLFKPPSSNPKESGFIPAREMQL